MKGVFLMHPDTLRGFRVAQGAQMGRVWFSIRSFVLGLLCIVLSIGVVSLALVFAHHGLR